MMRSNVSRGLCGVALLLIALTSSQAQQRPLSTATTPSAASAQTLGKEQLLAPEGLVKLLQSGRPKPLILNVGPRMLYLQAHIPGAEFIGPGSEPQGIAALKQRVKGLPKTTSMVLYCGCCPWQHCPNVAPAYQQLRSMGFTKVKVLYMATNLGVDWVYKGYPTER
jgi:thiosulfate/3-mercaptopyruvate sulfurtransferase